MALCPSDLVGHRTFATIPHLSFCSGGEPKLGSLYHFCRITVKNLRRFFIPPAYLLQDVRKRLDSGAGLAEVPHLLVHTQLDVGDPSGVQRLLQVGILHLLGVAELLHEQHQTLSAGLLDLIHHKVGTAVLLRVLIIEEDVVILVGKLLGQGHHGIALLAGVHTERAALLGHVVGGDGDLVVVKDLQQLGVVADDAGGDDLLALPVGGGQLGQLGVQGQ